MRPNSPPKRLVYPPAFPVALSLVQGQQNPDQQGWRFGTLVLLHHGGPIHDDKDE